MSCEILSVANSMGVQPKKGVIAEAYTSHLLYTGASRTTGTRKLLVDDTLTTAMIGNLPKNGMIEAAPEETHLVSSVRNIPAWCSSLGNLEVGNRGPITILINGFAANIVGSKFYLTTSTGWGTEAVATIEEGGAADWAVGANVNDTATNLAAYITTLPGVTATASTATVTIVRSSGTNYLNLVTDAGTDATIGLGPTWWVAARPSPDGSDHTYFTKLFSMNRRPTVFPDVLCNGFDIDAGDNFFRGTTRWLGRGVTGAQAQPTWTVGPTTCNHRPYVRGRANDSDAAPSTWVVNVEVGGDVPEEGGTAVPTLKTQKSGDAAFWPASGGLPVYLDVPFEILDENGDSSGLWFILERGPCSVTPVNAANLRGDTVTITVANDSGSTAYVLTEGVDWFADIGVPTVALAAESLKTAINNGVPGVRAELTGTAEVQIHRTCDASGTPTTGITLASSGGADIALVTETVGNTLTAADNMTFSTRETEPTQSFTADNRYVVNSLEVKEIVFDGGAWRVKPRTWKLNYTPGFTAAAPVVSRDVVEGHPPGTAACSVDFTVATRDNQILNRMWNNHLLGSGGSSSAFAFECQGALVANSNGDRLMLRAQLAKGFILPFDKNIRKIGEDVEAWTMQITDEAQGNNDFLELQCVTTLNTLNMLG